MYRSMPTVAALAVLALFCSSADAADPIGEAFGRALARSKAANAAFEDEINRQLVDSAPLGKVDGRWVFVVDLMPSMARSEIYWAMDATMAESDRGLVDEIISGKAGLRPPRFGMLLIPEEMFDDGFLFSRGVGGMVPWGELDDIRANDFWPLVARGAVWLGQALAGSALFAGIASLFEGTGCENNDTPSCNWPGDDDDSPDGSSDGEQGSGCSPTNWDACQAEDDSDDGDRDGEPDGSVIDPGWQDLVNIAAQVPLPDQTVLVTASGLCVAFDQ